MAEAEEAVTEVAEVAPETELETAEAPVVEPIEDDDKEPGGSDGASVYARKKGREAKQLRAELDQERAERIRVEERARLLEEQRNKPAQTEKERIYTPAEVWAAVEKGTIEHADAVNYIAEVAAMRVAEREAAKRQALAPLERAKAEVNEWVKVMPSLGDSNSADFKIVAAKYHHLVNNRHQPDDYTTRVLAAEMVFGDLEAARKRTESNTLSRQAPRMPSDSSGGQVSKVAKPPPEVEALWDQMHTTPEQRKVEWAIMQKSKRS
jgi:hypothetical protein